MKIIPNQICEGIGETPLEERIATWLLEAEQWFAASISPLSFISGSGMEEKADTVIRCRALWMAAPALDITMHPNGLAVVRTDSLVPASAERSAEFRNSIMRLMMETITEMLPALCQIPEWRESGPATSVWYATTFHSPLSICQAAGEDCSWDAVMRSIPLIKTAEDADALRFWSYPMLNFLRSYQGEEVSLLYLRQLIRNTVADQLMRSRDPQKASSYFRDPRFHDLKIEFVDFCRRNPELCELWHGSGTARIYDNPTIFRNEKSSSGYFF